jgi:hypothetical protein
MPDDVFLVNTGSGVRFFVTQVRSAGKPCLLMGNETDNWEFDASILKTP